MTLTPNRFLRYTPAPLAPFNGTNPEFDQLVVDLAFYNLMTTDRLVVLGVLTRKDAHQYELFAQENRYVPGELATADDARKEILVRLCPVRGQHVAGTPCPVCTEPDVKPDSIELKKKTPVEPLSKDDQTVYHSLSLDQRQAIRNCTIPTTYGDMTNAQKLAIRNAMKPGDVDPEWGIFGTDWDWDDANLPWEDDAEGNTD